MGKNQAHKAIQAARHSSRGDGEPGELNAGDGVDVSFHSAAWHEARIAALSVERPSYEEWKQRQKEAEAREEMALEEQERAMREYREGLAADRAARLGLGDAGVKAKRKKHKKERKESSKHSKKSKHKKSRSSKKKKRRRSSSSSSSSSSGSGSSDSESSGPRSGPVKLSEFFSS